MDIKRNNEKPITMDDLALPFLKQASKDSSSTLKRKLVALSDRQSLSTKGKGKGKGKEKEKKDTRKKTSSKTPDIISAPLPKVIQDRIQRKAAYTESSKNISKWLPVVMENRKADHLSFPLNETPNTTRVSSATLVAKFEPTTTLEHEIENILKNGTESTTTLKNGGLPEHGTQSLEEMKKKQIELQKMRSFLFFQERKMKQSAKIKSKSYHRIMKKEKLKTKLAIEDETAQMRQRMKREMDRAKERMTLRHRGSQRQLHQGNTETDKQLIMEELKRIEALKKKVSLGSSDSEIQSDEADSEAEGDDQEHDTAAAHKKSSLFNMKFMQREKTAAKKKESETKDNDGLSENDQSQEGEEEEEESDTGNTSDSTMHSDEEDENAENENENGKNNQGEIVGRKAFKKSKQETEVHSGPGVVPFVSEKPSMTLIESPFSIQNEKSHSMHANQPSRQSELNPWSELDTSSFAILPKKKNLKKLKDEASTASSVPLIGLSDENEGLVLKDDTQIRLQKDLIQQAFANDDVFREFEEEKSKIMEEDAPKDKDITLPGWGSWGGAGVDLSQVKRIIQKAKPGEGIQPSQRKDAKLKHVIMNEKKIKSIAKYQLDQVPYPFENRLQYEASQRMPVGKEWNALSAYRNQIRPRVQTKTGTIIAPLKYAKKNKTEPA